MTHFRRLAALGVVAAVTAAGGRSPAAPSAGSAWRLTTLASFGENESCNPQAALAEDDAGNLYGYTSTAPRTGDATLFRIAAGPKRTRTTLYTFHHTNGEDPVGAPVVDAAGNVYGTTTGIVDGHERVFEVRAGTTDLVIVCDPPRGSGIELESSLFRDAAGRLLVVATDGQSYGHTGLYRVDPTARKLRLFCPLGGAKESIRGEISEDRRGNLYVTAPGAVYRIAAGGKKAELVAKRATRWEESIGGEGWSAVVADRQGNLFGAATMSHASLDGEAFEIPAGSHKVVTRAKFSHETTGSWPVGPLAIDRAGNVYGITEHGGSPTSDAGAIYRLTAGTRQLEIIYRFPASSGPRAEGASPRSGPILGRDGALYGTTIGGGPGEYGTVYRLSPPAARKRSLVRPDSRHPPLSRLSPPPPALRVPALSRKRERGSSGHGRARAMSSRATCW